MSASMYEDFEWLNDSTPEDAYKSKQRDEKSRLWADLERADSMSLLELQDLQTRISKARDNTKATIDVYHEEAKHSAPTDQDLDWLRRARYADRCFARYLSKTHALIKQAAKQEAADRVIEYARIQKETAKKRQEEKTRRHQISTERTTRVREAVIGLIRRGNLLSDEILFDLYRQAEAIVDAEAGVTDS